MRENNVRSNKEGPRPDGNGAGLAEPKDAHTVPVGGAVQNQGVSNGNKLSANSPVTPAAPDPFDIESLKVEQSFADAAGLERPVLTIPIKKPSREAFFRTHLDQDYWLQTTVLDLRDSREIFLVAPGIREELATEATFGVRLLVVCTTLQGTPFLWPLRVPSNDGRLDNWSESALQAAEAARTRWTRLTSNMELGAYTITTAKSEKPPVFPKMTMTEILRVAFKNAFIDSLQHPALKRLRGEA